MIIIRRANLADKHAIFKFLSSAYKSRAEFKYPYRWEWAYENNPYWTDAGLPIQIAVDEGVGVVGQSAALVEPLVVDGQEFRVGWGVDFFVLPQYRKHGLGTRLQAANIECHQIFMSLSMSEVTQKIKSRLGMQQLPSVPEFTKVVCSKPELVQEAQASSVAGVPAPEPSHLRARLHKIQDSRRDWRVFDRNNLDTVIEEIDVFDEEVDMLWERLSPKFSTLVRRDAAYLNRKFVRQPHMTHTRFVARREGNLAGYIIVRRAQQPERNVGIICDLFTDPEDENLAQTLITHAINHLRAQHVASITAATSVNSFQAVLQLLGFQESRRVTPMVQAGIEVPLAGQLFGKGDHDWDQYPLA